MTLQQFQYVIAICETGSFSKAAEQLYMSQPSLTSAVKALEEELGIALFNRGRKGATLTAEGLRFLPYARQIFCQYEALLERYGRGGKHRQIFSVSTQHYSFAVKAFVELCRKVDVSQYAFALRETKTRDVIDDVASLRSEIGILYLSDYNSKAIGKLLSASDLAFHHLFDCSAYVYLWRGHPLAGKSSIAFADLAPYPCLSFEQGEGSSFYLAEEILSTNEYSRTIRICDRATALNLMVGLNGYTLCSGIICKELNGGDFIAVPYEADADNPNSVMDIGYITRKNIRLSPLGQQYIRELRRYLKLQDDPQEAIDGESPA